MLRKRVGIFSRLLKVLIGQSRRASFKLAKHMCGLSVFGGLAATNPNRFLAEVSDMLSMKNTASPDPVSPVNHSPPAHAAQLQEVVDAVHEKYKDVEDGAVATYIPELAKANPNHFGLCLATVDGHVFCAGDWDKEFTIQSMCKPFAFQMALEQHGVEETLKHVGIEPSGDAFNSIELDPKTARPFTTR